MLLHIRSVPSVCQEHGTHPELWVADNHGAHDWNGWIAFFLQALIEQATENNQKATTIIDLYEEME